MTILPRTFICKYIGLSTDTKPQPNPRVAISLPTGSEFYETDTFNTYMWDGTNWVLFNGKTLKTIPVDINATGHVVPAVTGKKIKVYAVKLIVSAAISINFRDGAATDLEGSMSLTANAGYVESVTPPFFLFCTAAGNDLDLVIVGAGTVTGRISYWDNDAT